MEGQNPTNRPQEAGSVISPQPDSLVVTDATSSIPFEPVEVSEPVAPAAAPKERKLTGALAIFCLVIVCGILGLAYGLYAALSHISEKPAAITNAVAQSVPIDGAGQQVDQPFLLQGAAASSLQVSNTNGNTNLSFENPTQNNQITVPNASGVVCLNINNCNYVTPSQLTNKTASLQNVAGQLQALSAKPSVTSLQGQTGNVELTAGTGINVSGTTISNSGITSVGTATGSLKIGRGLSVTNNTLASTVSITSSVPNLSVSDDGNGNFTITGQSGSGFLALGPATAQVDTSNNPSVFVNKTGSGNLLQFQGNGTNTFVVGNSGQTYLTTTTDSTTGFQVQNANGTSVLNVDTVNGRLGVNTASPAYALDVNGDINTNSSYKINGVNICTSGGCTAASGSGDYIQNGIGVQAANFNVQAANSDSIAGVLQAASSGSGDILDLRDGSGTNVVTVSSTGNVLIQPSIDSATGFQLQNSTGGIVFDADTTDGRIGIDNNSPAYALDVNGDINSNTAVRVGGVAVCTISDCTPASGSDNYIQNGTTVQGAANISIRSAATNAVTEVLQGASGQTSDILDLQGWNGTSTTTLDSFNANGYLGINTTPNYPLDVNGDVNTNSSYKINGTDICTSSGCTAASGSSYYIQNGIDPQTADFNITGNATVGGTATVGALSVTNDAAVGGALSVTGSTTLSSSLAVAGSLTASGTATFQDSVDSLTAFQVQNASSSAILDVDTLNGRIGIDNNSPAYALDVNGDINSNTAVRVGGVAVCTVDGCTAAANSGSYIQNGTTTQTAANFNIRSAATNSPVAVLQGADGQTADLLDLQSWNGTSTTTLDSFSASGNLTIGTLGTSTEQLYVSGTIPTYVGENNDSNSNYPQSIYVQGNYAYVVGGGSSHRLLVYNISSGIPVYVGESNNNNLSNPKSVYVQGSYAYVANSGLNELVVYNISNPADPTYVGENSDSYLDYPQSVYVQGNYAYVTSLDNNKLVVYNISSGIPVYVGENSDNDLSDPYSVYVQGNYAYVTSFSKLVVYNISSGTPVYVGENSDSNLSDPISVYVQGSYAYVASTLNSKLVVYNISNPTSPVYVGENSDNNLSSPSSVYVQGNYAYVTSRNNNELVVYNVANPADPTYTAENSDNDLSDPYSVYVQGNYAYVASYDNSEIVAYNLGGSSIQQLSVGGTETGTLQVLGNDSIGGDESITGGLSVGGSTELYGNVGISGSTQIVTGTNSTTAFQVQNASGTNVLDVDTSNQQVNIGALSAPGTVTAMLAPAAPTLSTAGTAGSTSYTYEVAAVSANGATTYGSLTTTISTANATLTTGNYNTISWTAVAGAVNYYVYRTASGGSPSSTGLIGSTTGTSLNDTGLSASGTIPATGGSLAASTTYYFKVTSLDNTGGETIPSSEVSATTTSTNKAITLSWPSVPGARSYRVYYATSAGTEAHYWSTPINSFTVFYLPSSIAGTPPTVSSAYGNNLTNSANATVTIGDSGTATGQLYVGGSVPTSAVGEATTGTNPYSVVTQGNYAYVANEGSNTIQIFDISNPASPALVSTTSTGTNPYYVAVSGNYAYVANYGSNDFQIFDISNPLSPTLVSTTNTGSEPRYIAISGRYAYVANYGSNTIQTFDISSPTSPVALSTVTVNYGPDAIAISGRYAYVSVAVGYGMRVLDLSNPASPVNVGFIQFGAMTPYSIAISGHYAYMPGSGGALHIINVSNPANPVSVSSVSYGSGGSPASVITSGRYLYVTDNYGYAVQIFDISNPAGPVSVGRIPTLNNASSLAISGRYAYVTNAYSGILQVFDLGGTYTQSLQAGSAEVSTLQVDQNEQVDGSSSITGGLNVGGTAQISSGLGVSGSALFNSTVAIVGGIQGGATVNGLSTPGAPTVTPTGGTAAGYSYYYQVAAVSASGGTTPASTTGNTTNGYASLSSSAYDQISWSPVTGAVSYNIYRASGGTGSPSTAGLIGNTSSTTFNDTGLSASTAAPTADTSGQLTVNGFATFKNTTNSTNAFQVQNASGTDVLNVDTANARVGIDVTYSSMSAPTGLAVGTATSGGSLATSTTYYYEVTAIDSIGGETTPSAEAHGATTSSNETLPLTWTAVTGASGYKVYRSTTSGSEVYLTTVLTNSFTDSGSFTPQTATPPTTNTAYTSTNLSNNNGQLSIGGNGTPAGQLYVGGSVPTSAVGSTSTDINGPEGIYVQGNYAYVDNYGTYGMMTIYNISNPSAPAFVGSVNLGGGITGIAVEGNYAYVVNNSTANLKVINVSNPASPTVVATVSMLGHSNTEGVYVAGEYVYVLAGAYLQIFNVSNPSAPVSVGSVSTGAEGYSVYVQDGYAYIANYSIASLQIFNVSNPSAPVSVGSITTTPGTDGVYVQNGYAYVTTSNDYLQIYNVSNPASITSVGSMKLPYSGNPITVFVQGQYAYVTYTGSANISVINISNPSDPVSVGAIPTAGGSSASFVSGRYLYTVNYYLQIFDLGGTYTQALQAGSAEVSTLQVDQNEQVAGSSSITGGLNVGGNAQVSGSLGVSGNTLLQGTLAVAGGIQGGATVNGLATPGTPSVSNVDTAGTTSYSYAVAAVSASGGTTPASTAGSTSTGNATLTTSNYNTITWAPVAGAVNYYIYRTSSSGTPSSTGYIGSSTSATFNDTGIAGTTAAPTTDTSGQLTVNGYALYENKTNSTTAFQIENASGTSILTVDTSGSQVTIAGALSVQSMSISGALTVGGGATFSGSVSVGHLVGGGSAPGVVAGAGAGSSPTVSVSGTDTAGEITLTTGSSPSLSSTIVTLTFNSAYASAPYVVFSPANANAAALSGDSSIYVNSTTTNFTLNADTTALTAAAQYEWTYHVVQ